MKFDLKFERVYPHPPEVLWRALTQRNALGDWLMQTDFVAEPGRSFWMRCEREDGSTEQYRCQVLALEPSRRMLWSWELDDRREGDPMYVEFLLEPVSQGTRLTIRHYGDRDPAVVDAFKGGWPARLDQLTAVAG